MKTPTEFGPWTVSAHDCRMNSFWKQRLVALQSNKAKGTSRGHWIGLFALIAFMVGMPSWQLGQQTATAQESPTISSAPVPPPEFVRDGPGVPPTAQRSQIAVPPKAAKALPRPIPQAARPWQLIDSPQLPASDKIVLVVGQERNLDMPKGGSVSTEGFKGIFSTKVDEASGDILIRGLKSGVGRLKYANGQRKNVEFQVVIVADPVPLKVKLEKVGMRHITLTPGIQSVTLTGNVKTPSELKSCIAMADELYPHVVNNIRIQNDDQVQLHCQVFEFTTTDAKLGGVLDALFQDGKRQEHGEESYSSIRDGNAFKTIFKQLAKTTKVKMIAEPVLTTVSGRPAAFRAGSEFPILIPQGPGTVAVEYKQLGTRVDFVPVILKDGRIRLNLRPQLSAISHDGGVEVSGTNIPGLKQRWVEVAADMNAGQAMLAVLVHENKEGQKVGFVTLVRPELVSPIDPSELPIAWKQVPMTRPPEDGTKTEYQALDAPSYR